VLPDEMNQQVERSLERSQLDADGVGMRLELIVK
jgi:hypothetical protein